MALVVWRNSLNVSSPNLAYLRARSSKWMNFNLKRNGQPLKEKRSKWLKFSKSRTSPVFSIQSYDAMTWLEDRNSKLRFSKNVRESCVTDVNLTFNRPSSKLNLRAQALSWRVFMNMERYHRESSQLEDHFVGGRFEMHLSGCFIFRTY